ncbi:MAG: mismatch-specific DNA-glycosylase [Gammaproteobacteria bacterium]
MDQDGELKSVKNLPDFLTEGLIIVSIGINPSLPSVRNGYPFANPRNRFWRALNASKLVDEPLTPGVAAVERLLRNHRIGFTDVVKKPSAQAAQLSVSDFEREAPRLQDKLLRLRPRIAWFHGKTAFEKYLRHAEGRRHTAAWGLQDFRISDTICFVTPNPSPANAAYSLDVLISHYDRLAAVRVQVLQR